MDKRAWKASLTERDLELQFGACLIPKASLLDPPISFSRRSLLRGFAHAGRIFISGICAELSQTSGLDSLLFVTTASRAEREKSGGS